jgi:hypothetical protein
VRVANRVPRSFSARDVDLFSKINTIYLSLFFSFKQIQRELSLIRGNFRKKKRERAGRSMGIKHVAIFLLLRGKHSLCFMYFLFPISYRVDGIFGIFSQLEKKLTGELEGSDWQ